MNKKITFKVFGILLSVLVFQNVLYYFNVPGKLSVLLIIPLLFSVFFFIKGIISFIKKNRKNFILNIFTSILIFLISIKLSYVFYNIFISVILLILVFVLTKKIKTNNQNLKSIIYNLIIINIIITFIPDISIFKYLIRDTYTSWTNVSVNMFKGEIDTNSNNDAKIALSTRWKINKVFNYPQAIVLPTMIQNDSWFKTGKNNKSLLMHEQGHFDIEKIYSEMLLDSIKNAYGANSQEIKKIILSFINKKNICQEQYDNETKYGTIKSTQKEWTNMINSCIYYIDYCNLNKWEKKINTTTTKARNYNDTIVTYTSEIINQINTLNNILLLMYMLKNSDNNFSVNEQIDQINISNADLIRKIDLNVSKMNKMKEFDSNIKYKNVAINSLLSIKSMLLNEYKVIFSLLRNDYNENTQKEIKKNLYKLIDKIKATDKQRIFTQKKFAKKYAFNI